MDTLFPVADTTYEQLRDSGRIRGDAHFSPCERYRYWLARIWDGSRPFVNFLLLNPSTATGDPRENDATMERCCRYAFDWGYGGQHTTNIHAYRATLPEDMKRQADPTGPDNDRWIVEIAQKAGVVVCGWGTHGQFRDRGAQVLALLRAAGVRPHCLKLNVDGSPNHPLYLRKTLRPILIP